MSAAIQAQRDEAHERMQRMGVTFSPDNRAFIVSAQIYLMLAGIGLVLDGSFLSDSLSRPAFLHLFTLGFMLFMMYGLGAHMLPRFTGNALTENGRAAWFQMALAHCGVLGYAVGYFAEWPWLALMGASMAWLSLLVFSVRMWPVMWPEVQE
jgi:uncharacterized protein involved in response to NO